MNEYREFSSFYDMKEWLKRGEFTLPAIYKTTNDGKYYFDDVLFTSSSHPTLYSEFGEGKNQGITFNSEGEVSKVLTSLMDSNFFNKRESVVDSQGVTHYKNQQINVGSDFKVFRGFKHYGSVIKHKNEGANNQKFTNMIFPHQFAKTNISEIVIPEGIEYIGGEAFYKCTNLTSVVLPSTLKRIGRGAFKGCINLTEIHIPEHCEIIESGAFLSCSSLEKVTISKGVFEIGQKAFYNTAIETLWLPEGVHVIGHKAFAFCRNLTKVYIGRNVNNREIVQEEKFGVKGNLKGTAFYKSPIEKFIVDPRNEWVKTGINGELMKVNGGDTWMIMKVPYSFKGMYVADPSAKSMIRNLFEYCYDGTFQSIGNVGPYITGINFNNINTIPKYCFKGNRYITELVMPHIHNINSNPFNNGWVNKITIGGDDDYLELNPVNFLQGKKEEREYDIQLANNCNLVLKNGNKRMYYGHLLGQCFTETDWWLNLNSQWKKGTITNPNPSLYDGVYESYSNKNVNSQAAAMTINLFNYDYFHFYVRSYGEDEWDYVMVSQIDTDITNDTSYDDTSLVKAHTYGLATSGTAIENYVHVEFDNISKGKHVINVLYRKDGSEYDGTDNGFLLIPYNQMKGYYKVTLNNWQQRSSSIAGYTNFESLNRYTEADDNANSDTWSSMKIEFEGYPNFLIHVGSSSEGNYDYVCVAPLDTDLTSKVDEYVQNGDTYMLKDEPDFLFTSGHDFYEVKVDNIGSYESLQLTNDGDKHYIMIYYVKDTSSYDLDDRGYVAIPNTFNRKN